MKTKRKRNEDLKEKEDADTNFAMLTETCHCVCEASMKKTKTATAAKKDNKDKMVSGSSVSNSKKTRHKTMRLLSSPRSAEVGRRAASTRDVAEGTQGNACKKAWKCLWCKHGCHQLQTRSRFGLVSSNYLVTQCYMSFLGNRRAACQIGTGQGPTKSTRHAAANGWVKMWMQLCLLPLKAVDPTAQFSALGGQAHPQWNMQVTYHLHHQGKWAPERLRSGSKVCPIQQPSHRRKTFWVPWERRWQKSQSSTPRALQVKQPYRTTEGWYKSQEQRSARNTCFE